MNHSARAGRLLAQWTAKALEPNTGSGGKHFFDVQQLDIEDGTSSFCPTWARPSAHIYDPNNLLYGQVGLHRVLAGVGPDDSTSLVITGGANVVVRPLMRTRSLLGSAAFGFPLTMPVPVSALGSSTLNSRIYLARWFGAGTVTKIRLNVAVQSGNICVGVYAGSTAQGIVNAQPGALKGTSGSIACPAAGYQDIALAASADINEGDWIALMADNNTASFGTNGNGSAATAWTGMSGFTATGGTTLPLPASVTVTNWENKVIWAVGVA